MRQNITSAGLQAGSSLAIAALTIGIFRLLGPEQMAFLRQHYFVPFALIASISPANQNYLRSVLFSQGLAATKQAEASSLWLIQMATSFVLLCGIVLAVDISSGPVSAFNIIALSLAVVMVLGRTLVTGVLEAGGRYSPSILLNNYSSVTPYIAALVMIFSKSTEVFFLSASALSLITLSIIVRVARRIELLSIVPIRLKPKPFTFAFKRYFSLSVISVGSVIVYQGVEFCLYNYTKYGNVEIANYALAFSAGAVMRQVIIVAIQPLEQERHYRGSVRIGKFGNVGIPTVIELVLYAGFLTAAWIVPKLLLVFFPDYASAGLFVPPLILGILGTAIQQVYSVRLIAEARTKFVSPSQFVLACTSIAATLALHSHVSLIALVWTLSALIWLRGCIVIPTYVAIAYGRRPNATIALIRVGLSALLFSMTWW